MTDDEIDGFLSRQAGEIERRAEAAYQRLLESIRAGTEARSAVQEANDSFEGEFYGVLASAFTDLLTKRISADRVRSMPLARITLSDRLYQNRQLVESTVLAAINRHNQAMRSARELALELYDGYGNDVDLLDVRKRLPRYLRDGVTGDEYARTISRYAAKRLKTPALRASYLEALDAAEAGRPQDKINRMLRTAFAERNRYFANRIAQTELHRAYMDTRGGELMADQSLEFVQIRLSPTHPKVDICDVHAKADLYGLGPGIYPKGRAPQPPYHPFCRCKAHPRYDVRGTASERPDAVRDLVQSRGDGARLMGSEAKMERLLNGEPLDSIVNEGVPKDYRLRRLGDGPRSPFVRD